MPETVVVADTTGYLPPDLTADYGIEQVPLHVLLPDGSDVLEDSYGGDWSSFYEILATSSKLPKTSQPSTGEFIEKWTPLLDEGKEIVAVHISGGISGTVDGARTAKDMLGERGSRVSIVDSHSAAGGTGLVVLAAAAGVRSGMDAAAAAAHAEAARDEMKIYFALDTLEYLEKGGRIGAASAWIGSALRIKPILSFGVEVEAVERVRTSKRVFERLLEYLQDLRDDGADAWCAQHSRAEERVDELVARGSEIMGRPPAFVSEIGAVMGVYAGPGMLGLGAMPSRYVES